MVPLYAAGAITEIEIANFETQLTREQLGLKKDVKSADIHKVMDLYTISTATVIRKMGTALRHNIQEHRRAKPVKKFVNKPETTEKDLIAEQERISKQIPNIRQYPLVPDH